MKDDAWQLIEDNSDWLSEFNWSLGPEWAMYKRKVALDQAIKELLDRDVG